MSIRSLKRMKRRLIPVIAIAAAIVPTTAQAQVMLDGGGSGSSLSGVVVRPDDRGARGAVFTQIAQPSSLSVTRPDDRGSRAGVYSQIEQPAVYDSSRFVHSVPAGIATGIQTAEPISVSSPSGFDWSSLELALLAFAGALAATSGMVAVRRHRHATPAV